MQDHSQRVGHLKRLKVPQETALVLTPSSGNIPIPLWFIFGLDEEHMDTRAHIALLAPPPPRATRSIPHISAVGGQGVGNRGD